MLRSLLAALAVATLAFAPAAAHEIRLGDLTLTDLWARATPPRAPTAGGYLTIANAGKEPDRLVAAASPLADKADFHLMDLKDGVMTMRPVAGGIEIPAGATVALAPGGTHIMFVGPRAPLVEGGKFPVTLTFEQAGTIATFLHVLSIGARGPEMDHTQMNMDP